MTSKTTNKFSPEVRARAVRMVLDHASEHPSRWAAVTSIAAKIGCTPQTLHDWVKKAEVDSGQRAGVPTDMADKLKALERAVRRENTNHWRAITVREGWMLLQLLSVDLNQRASASALHNRASGRISTSALGGDMIRRSNEQIAVAALLGMLGLAGFSTSSRAETGSVAVVFTKGGFIVGVGGGQGVLILHGKHYPFNVSGMSVGFTIGASTTKLVGRALNLRGPASIEGSYSAIGAGGAVAAGAGGVQLQNANGVILQLSGPKIGAEVSAAVGGVTIQLR